MGNREIKIRFWKDNTKEMLSLEQALKYLVNVQRLLKGEYDHFKPLEYIGLHDKNHAEICVGDIVDDHIGKGYVEYLDAAYRVNYGNGTCKWFIDYLKSEFKTIEVIGNIYENPELLKNQN